MERFIDNWLAEKGHVDTGAGMCCCSLSSLSLEDTLRAPKPLLGSLLLWVCNGQGKEAVGGQLGLSRLQDCDLAMLFLHSQ